MPGSNFELKLVSDTKEHFKTAMQLAFDNAPGKKAVAYRISPKSGMILYWASHKDATAFPYEMDVADATEFVWGWLKKVDFAEYDKYPDHDGDNKKGFKVFNEDWGRVERDVYSFVGILPCWHMYGK